MHAACILGRLQNGVWRIRHSSAALGDVVVTGSSREEALQKMQRELQYRMELCPCSGVSLGTIELQVSEEIEGRPEAD